MPSYGYDIFKSGLRIQFPKLTWWFVLQAVVPLIIGMGCFIYAHWDKKRKEKMDENFYKNLKDEPEPADNDMADMKPFDPLATSQDDRTKGVNPKYRWIQTDQEMEMFVFINKEIRSKDILLDILSTGIVLTICGKVVLDGDFYDEVNPSESHWQLDDDKNVRVLWITLVKKTKTQLKDYWRGVLISEQDHLDDN